MLSHWITALRMAFVSSERASPVDSTRAPVVGEEALLIAKACLAHLLPRDVDTRPELEKPLPPRETRLLMATLTRRSSLM